MAEETRCQCEGRAVGCKNSAAARGAVRSCPCQRASRPCTASCGCGGNCCGTRRLHLLLQQQQQHLPAAPNAVAEVAQPAAPQPAAAAAEAKKKEPRRTFSKDVELLPSFPRVVNGRDRVPVYRLPADSPQEAEAVASMLSAVRAALAAQGGPAEVVRKHALESVYSQIANALLTALVASARADIASRRQQLPRGVESVELELVREGPLTPRPDRHRFGVEYDPSGNSDFRVSVTVNGAFTWILLLVEMKSRSTFSKPHSVTQTKVQACCCCSLNTQMDTVFALRTGVDSLKLEDDGRCQRCSRRIVGVDDEDGDDEEFCECSPQLSDVEDEVGESGGTPNIPVFCALSDFLRWRIWKVSMLEFNRLEWIVFRECELGRTDALLDTDGVREAAVVSLFEQLRFFLDYSIDRVFAVCSGEEPGGLDELSDLSYDELPDDAFEISDEDSSEGVGKA